MPALFDFYTLSVVATALWVNTDIFDDSQTWGFIYLFIYICWCVLPNKDKQGHTCFVQGHMPLSPKRVHAEAPLKYVNNWPSKK